MWQKIRDEDFKNFKIEDLTSSFGEVTFYAPYETIRELKKVIDSSRLSDEEKINFLIGLSTAEEARDNLNGLAHSIQVLTTTLEEGALIGNSNRFVLTKYAAGFLDSSDIIQLDDGQKFEENGYRLHNIS